MAFDIRMTPDAADSLRSLSAFDRKTIQSEIRQHLAHQPTKVSRSRIKELDQPAISQFRLRVGEYRIYYNVDLEAETVTVLYVFDKGRGLTPEGDAS